MHTKLFFFFLVSIPLQPENYDIRFFGLSGFSKSRHPTYVIHTHTKHRADFGYKNWPTPSQPNFTSPNHKHLTLHTLHICPPFHNGGYKILTFLIIFNNL